MEIGEVKQRLIAAYRRAIDTVDGARCVRHYIETHPLGEHSAVIAIGKAAAAMMDGLPRAGEGLVISDRDYIPDNWSHAGIEVCLGEHPVPGQGSFAAGTRLVSFLQKLPANNEILFLVSGGTSSLVEVPAQGISEDDIRRANDWLLGSGLDIRAMNAVRKRLSQIKGGGLLDFLQPAQRVTALYLSDVRGDDPGTIGSGLLVPVGESTEVHASLPAWLARKLRRTDSRQNPPIDIHHEIVANLSMAKQAAAEYGREQDFDVTDHAEFVEGDAWETGLRLGRYLIEAPAGLHVWGGETTVQLPAHPGTGGRSQVLALGLASAIDGVAGISALAAGTDGRDGNSGFAGAFVDGSSILRAQNQGIDYRDLLGAANVAELFGVLGDGLPAGLTGTNVMDLVIAFKTAT